MRISERAYLRALEPTAVYWTSKKALVLLAMAADDAKVRLAAGWKAQGEAKTESGVDLRLENMMRGR
jgi:hypothetical protein